ncbi:MAG: tRNA-binding protein [Gammaproteobacteria bacterium]|nr:MAG: tRNA-binding protein [Gammaproteobacteria bacterium]
MNDSGISVEDFQRVDMRVGTVLSAELNPKARVSAYVLRIDFGELGKRISSAQITDNYSAEELVGRQIVAVANFPPKRVAGVRSEVLVLGAVTETKGVLLLESMGPVENGTRIA